MKNNRKNDSEKSVKGFAKAILDYQMDYLYNRSYVKEIVEKCHNVNISDFCKFGNVSINDKKETMPMYYHELDIQKIGLDLHVLEMDFEKWVESLTAGLNAVADDSLMVKVAYLGDGNDKPCLCVLLKEILSEYMQKAS